MSKLPLLLKRHAPAILTGASIIFAGGSCFFSARGALKAERLLKEERPVTKKDKVIVYIKAYWPAGTLFLASTAASIFSHKITGKQIAGLTAACIAAEEKLRSYRNAIKEEFGEEKEKDIYAKVVDENWNITPALPYKIEDYDDHSVFYDRYSERFFVSSVEKVQQAIYHLNRNFTLRGWALLNEYYHMLGLDDIPKGEVEGWSDAIFMEEYGMVPWIDIYTTVKEHEDGTKYFVLSFDIEPTVEAIERTLGPS